MLSLVLLLGQGTAFSQAPGCPQLLFFPVFRGTTPTDCAEPALPWGSSAVDVSPKHLQEQQHRADTRVAPPPLQSFGKWPLSFPSLRSSVYAPVSPARWQGMRFQPRTPHRGRAREQGSPSPPRAERRGLHSLAERNELTASWGI